MILTEVTEREVLINFHITLTLDFSGEGSLH